MTAETVRQYFAEFPQRAQMLIDEQREVVHKFGPLSVAGHDFFGVQVLLCSEWTPCNKHWAAERADRG